MPIKAEGKIIILGGGITGLTLAKELSAVYGDRVVVLEKENFTGGLAATLSRDELLYDLGSHRIHSDFSPKAINYIKNNLGVTLVKKRRNGALHYNGIFLKYPPDVFDFFKAFPVKKAIRIISSYFGRSALYKKTPQNYQQLMLNSVGPALYAIFYRNFALKLWGMHPREMSIDGAKRRKLFLDAQSAIRIISGKTKYFFYPRKGIGKIAENLSAEIKKNNGQIITGAAIKNIACENGKIREIIFSDTTGKCSAAGASLVISTIAIDSLYELIFKQLPPVSLGWRNLRIAYLHTGSRLIGGHETFYFPSRDTIIGRASDIRRYSPYINQSENDTLLTIEVPLSEKDTSWNISDEKFCAICMDDLKKTKIVKNPFKIFDCFSLRLEKAYPIYKLGWKNDFFAIYDRINAIDNLFTLGRKGLYLHCNIDHCMIQALRCADHILNGTINDKQRWSRETLKFFNFSARD